MKRFHQLLFVGSLLALSWYAMMAIHELGHVLGALMTHGHIERVVLHPLTISRTDVAPNPHPAMVVWLGPIIGCLIPAIVWLLIPRGAKTERHIAQFFAGFCLIGNGAYIAFGTIDRIGDCGEMMRTGSPGWMLVLFGVVTIPLGFYIWHRLGSLKKFLADPALIDGKTAYTVLLILLLLLAIEFAFSPR